MMKHALLLFARSSCEKGLADPAALAGLINNAKAGISASWAYFEDLLYYVDNDRVALHDTRNDMPVEAYSVVYFRYWGAVQGHAIAAARICKLKNVPYVDIETLRQGSQNKLTQYANLHEAQVLIPRSLMAHAPLLQKHYQDYGFNFPFIMKSKGGTRGLDNFLVRSQEDLERIVQNAANDTFVLQDFLPNDGDYRVIVFGDAVKMVIHRKAVGDTHLNNTSQGGSAEIVPVESLPTEVLEASVRAAQFFGRDVAGVDMVLSKDDGKYYCFEVNRAPQIEHASFAQEKAQILAEYLAKF